MSINGDWINTTPAANRTTFNPTLTNGFEKNDGVDGFSCSGTWNWKPDIVIFVDYYERNSYIKEQSNLYDKN